MPTSQNHGGEHIGQCSKLAKYFNCGKTRHIKKDCTLLNKDKKQEERQAGNNHPQNDKKKGKIYIAHVEEDNNEERMVRGIVLIINIKIHVLLIHFVHIYLQHSEQ